MLRAYGAECILSDPLEGHPGVVRRVEALVAAIPNAYCLDQFSNPANPAAHYRTTGPEIWKQTQQKVDIVCFGVGSSGTITGVGRYLKEKKPDIQIYAVEPYESSVLSGFPKGPHKIQGSFQTFSNKLRICRNRRRSRPCKRGSLSFHRNPTCQIG